MGACRGSGVNVENRCGLEEPAQFVYRIDIRRSLGRQLWMYGRQAVNYRHARD